MVRAWRIAAKPVWCTGIPQPLDQLLWEPERGLGVAADSPEGRQHGA